MFLVAILVHLAKSLDVRYASSIEARETGRGDARIECPLSCGQIRFKDTLPKKGAFETDLFTVGSVHSTPHTLRLLRGLGIGLLRASSGRRIWRRLRASRASGDRTYVRGSPVEG